jgi:hypothetical protein
MEDDIEGKQAGWRAKGALCSRNGACARGTSLFLLQWATWNCPAGCVSCYTTYGRPYTRMCSMCLVTGPAKHPASHSPLDAYLHHLAHVALVGCHHVAACRRSIQQPTTQQQTTPSC